MRHKRKQFPSACYPNISIMCLYVPFFQIPSVNTQTHTQAHTNRNEFANIDLHFTKHLNDFVKKKTERKK